MKSVGDGNGEKVNPFLGYQEELLGLFCVPLEAHGGQVAKRPEEDGGWETGEVVWSLQDVVFRARSVGEMRWVRQVRRTRSALPQLVIGTQVTQEMLPLGALWGIRQGWELLLCKMQSSPFVLKINLLWFSNEVTGRHSVLSSRKSEQGREDGL